MNNQLLPLVRDPSLEGTRDFPRKGQWEGLLAALRGQGWTGCSTWRRTAERTARSRRTDLRRIVRPDSRATSRKWTRHTEHTRPRSGEGVRRPATGPPPPPTPPPPPNRNAAAFLNFFRCLLWTKCCSGLTAGEGGRRRLY